MTAQETSPVVAGAAGRRRDRIAGVLVGTAVGDALGAGYEFDPPFGTERAVDMIGGGPHEWSPGEWTDDTAMAWVIADALVAGDALATSTQDRISGAWVRWGAHAPDVGIQTRAVFGLAREVSAGRAVSAAALGEAARAVHESTGRSGGNGSLMRTAPVALAYLYDGAAATMARASMELSALTHFDPEAGEACVIWCGAIRHSVRAGELSLEPGLELLPADRADAWRDRVAAAEGSQPRDFAHNGWVVEALQAAWCAIATTAEPDAQATPNHATRALAAAVRGGHDTDTVAAIAGGLLGAAYGASAFPARWREMTHGWPGRTAADLAELALAIACR